MLHWAGQVRGPRKLIARIPTRQARTRGRSGKRHHLAVSPIDEDVVELDRGNVSPEALIAAGRELRRETRLIRRTGEIDGAAQAPLIACVVIDVAAASRSEERRVGKECRSRWSAD